MESNMKDGTSSVTQKPKKPVYKKWWFWVLAVIVVFIVIGALGGGGDKTNTEATPSQQVGTADKDAAVAATTAPETKPNVSVEYLNALAQAQTYSDQMHMSKKGLYDQLTSEYGGQFEADAAQYAIDNVDADWNANALAQAKTYQATMSMSKNAVYDQLISEYGGQFTAEEAQYAIDNLG